MAVTNQYIAPKPIPVSYGEGPMAPAGGQKLAFFRGPHPAFAGDIYPNAKGSLAMPDQDNTQWAGAYRGSVQYPREISANNHDQWLGAAPESMTQFLWGVINNVRGVVATSSRLGTANFFASDPMQFKSNGGGFVAGIHGGGISLNGMVPSGAWSFVTPGTAIVRPVYRQNYYGPVNPTMTTKDLQASSIYNPLPAFGTTVPTLP